MRQLNPSMAGIRFSGGSRRVPEIAGGVVIHGHYVPEIQVYDNTSEKVGNLPGGELIIFTLIFGCRESGEMEIIERQSRKRYRCSVRNQEVRCSS